MPTSEPATVSGPVTPETIQRTVATVALSIFAADQLSKYAVLQVLGYAQEYVVLDGFFKFVHWGNTGAAWSMFNQLHGSNDMLAVVSLLALLALMFSFKQFNTATALGRISLGLMIGGIIGNLVDRLHPERRHVIDFIYFYAYRRSGEEIGFPAFNVADSAICVGVGLMMLLMYQVSTPSLSTADSKAVVTEPGGSSRSGQ